MITNDVTTNNFYGIHSKKKITSLDQNQIFLKNIFVYKVIFQSLKKVHRAIFLLTTYKTVPDGPKKKQLGYINLLISVGRSVGYERM